MPKNGHRKKLELVITASYPIVQWAFKECFNIDKYLFSKENVADFEYLWMFKDSLRLE